MKFITPALVLLSTLFLAVSATNTTCNCPTPAVRVQRTLCRTAKGSVIVAGGCNLEDATSSNLFGVMCTLQKGVSSCA